MTGRPGLYDATHFSGNGEAACASCHIFGDNDDLAWDLGNPDDVVKSNPIPSVNGGSTVFHPMKGPMTTQTLRGLVTSGAMHWRGDRSNGFFGVDPTDPNLSFNNFIVAFQGLIGSVDMPTTAQMQAFTNFQLQVVMPPNPVRNLDNSLTTAQSAGKSFFAGTRPADPSATCNGCHALDPAQGEFGTSKNVSFEGIVVQNFKIPQLRNIYTKIGMFGDPKTTAFEAADSGNTGSQVRGFGFTNDGSVDTLFRFFTAIVFHPRQSVGFPLTNPDQTRRNVEQYMLAFDSDLAPIVGQQVTLTSSNGSAVGPRITLFEQRANAAFTSKVLGGTVKECELVARVAQGGVIQGFLFDPVAGNFVPSGGGTALSDSALRALAAVAGQEVTYTCVPPGSGARIAATR